MGEVLPSEHWWTPFVFSEDEYLAMVDDGGERRPCQALVGTGWEATVCMAQERCEHRRR